MRFVRVTGTSLLCVATLLGALMNTACKQPVCTELKGFRFDVELDEPYGPSSIYEYNPSAGNAPRPEVSCGDLEMGVRTFQVTTPRGAQDCGVYWGTLDGVSDPPNRAVDEDDRYTNSPALTSLRQSDIVAERSRVSIDDVCPGIYTLVMRRTVFEGDDLRLPVPGELPPWVVVRSFEAEGPCPSLTLNEAGVCTDVWAAHVTARERL